MPQQTGTRDINTLLAVQDQSAAEYGLDDALSIIEAEYRAHNELMEDMLGSLVDITTDRLRKYGIGRGGAFQRVDEYAPAPAQRSKGVATAGFPLDRHQYNVGWTATRMQQATPNDLARDTLDVITADRINVTREIKRAVFGPTNYTFEDWLTDKIDLEVKRFVNADGAGIPVGPNGEVFDGATHTHYDAIAGLTEAALKAQIDDVVEHGHGQDVRVAINRADQTTVEGFAGFKEFKDVRLVPGISEDHARGTLDTSVLDNRAIGLFHGAVIWTKPWVPADYSFCWSEGATEKPLVMRQQKNTALQGLRLAAQDKVHPLMVDFFERDVGFAAWNRTNGHVLYFGGGTYVTPTF